MAVVVLLTATILIGLAAVVVEAVDDAVSWPVNTVLLAVVVLDTPEPDVVATATPAGNTSESFSTRDSFSRISGAESTTDSLTVANC